MTMKVLEIGGRVKSAAVGLEHLFAEEGEDVLMLNKRLERLRREPPATLTKAFFPLWGRTLSRRLQGAGFYRPSLKTDQGMGGNFYPFFISASQKETDFKVHRPVREEILALPEEWAELSQAEISGVQQALLDTPLDEVRAQFNDILSRRRVAEKGRAPFFMIRPAALDEPLVLGNDTLVNVERAVNGCVERIIAEAARLEERDTGMVRPANLLFCQPDVFILADKTVCVERVNVPDVGMFLACLKYPRSELIQTFGSLAFRLFGVVADIIATLGKNIAIVTREEVVRGDEDILEQMELASLLSMLGKRSVSVEMHSPRTLPLIHSGVPTILLNIEYETKGGAEILAAHKEGRLTFFPNPYVQLAAQTISGMPSVEIPEKFKQGFLNLLKAQPKDEEALSKTLHHIDSLLKKSEVAGDILYVDLGGETVPVVRNVLHSWRQVALRAQRQTSGKGPITLRSLPVTHSNRHKLLVEGGDGPRLHLFRFMAVTT